MIGGGIGRLAGERGQEEVGWKEGRWKDQQGEEKERMRQLVVGFANCNANVKQHTSKFRFPYLFSKHWFDVLQKITEVTKITCSV